MEPLAAGQRFGNYELQALIGVGGMGAVYRAVHPAIGKVVAIKVLKPELAADQAAVARFFDEARAATAIRHEGIVDIFDLGRRDDGTVYYVMEHLPGEDLAQLLHREGRLSAPRAVALVKQVCAPLAAAHRRGIVHRDLKPQNLFVMPRGADERVKVLDFGIAKLLGQKARPDTSTGVVLGTVHYMSPEQAKAEPLDGRADLYSLGCILYELLTGTLPFAAKNAVAALARLATEQAAPPSARAPDLPAGLDEVVLRALAKDPAERFADAEEMAAALGAIDFTRPRTAERPAAREPSGPYLAEARPAVDAVAPTMRSIRPPLMTPDPHRATPEPLAREASGEGARAEQEGDRSRRLRAVGPVGEGESAPRSRTTSPRAVAAASEPRPASDPPPGERRPSSSPPPSGELRTGVSGPVTARQTVPTPPAIASAESVRLLAGAPPPLLDADAERRVVRWAIPVVLAMLVGGIVLYLLPSTSTRVDRALLGRWLPVFAVDIAAIALLMIAVLRTGAGSRARYRVNRALTLLTVSTITVAVHLTGSLTSYDLLYYPLAVIIDRLREDRRLARFTLIAATLGFVGTVALEQLGVIAYAPLYPASETAQAASDRSLAGLAVTVVVAAMLISFRLIDFLATRVQKREQELRELGRGLAGRIDEQLELLRRSEDLRRYVSPQLAEAILRGEGAGGFGSVGHVRRRLTMARLDCGAIARAAEVCEPEEFAHLLNDFFARAADSAAVHGGTVDRFAGAELSVLFGAPDTRGPAEDALAAVQFALDAVPAVRQLEARCEAAGVEEPPRGRAAVHTGFATVGSFGSPSRLEYTAVGPHVEAVAALLAEAPTEAVLLSHATYVLVRERVAADPAGERPLPGARHPVKLYRARSVSDRS